jgi:hypothetical protein
MTVDQLLQALSDRHAVLYVEDGRLKYAGPKRPPGDPIRAAIQEHRAELVALFSPARPEGWSDCHQRETLEPVPDHPGLWREPATSAVRCIWCPEPLADGDLLSCEQHRTDVGVTPRPVRRLVAVTWAPVMGRDDLLALAERHGWEALPFKPGERVGGTEQMWRAFVDWAHGETLRAVLAAVWDRWGPAVQQYSQESAAAAPGASEAA